MSDAEKELLKKAKEGDIESFERLIESCQKRVFNIAYRMIGNFDDANELAQEVFLKIFKSLKNFREDSMFSTWVYKLTTNICLDELRRRKNRKVISLDEEVFFTDSKVIRQVEDQSPTPQIQVENKELKMIINNAIKRLSEEHRIMIVLRDIQGFSYEEISKILKCSEGTVKSRLNRARNQLRKLLKGEMELLNGDFVKPIEGGIKYEQM